MSTTDTLSYHRSASDLRAVRAEREYQEELRLLEAAAVSANMSRWLRAASKGESGQAYFDVGIEQRDLTVGTPAAGGLTVAGEFAPRLVESMVATSGVLRAAQVFVTQTGATMGVPTATGATTASIVAEGALIGESDPTFGQTSLGAFKYSLLLDMSNELLLDGLDLAPYIAREAGRAVGAGVGAHFATGTGTGQPLGVVAAASPYTVSTAPAGNVTAFSSIAIRQFAKALAAEYRPTATWLIAANDFVELAAIPEFSVGLNSPNPTLLGSPVLIDPFLPAPAASAKSLVYGDLSRAYVVRQVQRVRFDQSAGQFFSTDQMRFRVTTRTDGRPTLAAAAIIGQHSAT